MSRREYSHYRRFMGRLISVLAIPSGLRTFKQWILLWHWKNSIDYSVKYYLREGSFSPGQSLVLRNLLAQVEQSERK